MFGIVFDIIFAVCLIGASLWRFLTSSPGNRGEKGCLLMVTIILFTIYFIVLPPQKEETNIENMSVPKYLK